MKRYVWLMRILGAIYALLALGIFVFPAGAMQWFNSLPEAAFVGAEPPVSAQYFWTMHSVAYLTLLSALSFLSAESPRVRGYALAQILCKTVSSAGFFTLFLNQGHYFAYLGSSIIDLLIAAVISWFLIRLPREQRDVSQPTQANSNGAVSTS